MKKYVLFYLTGLTSVWLMDSLLSGIKIGDIVTALFMGVFISFSIWFTEYIVQQLTKKTMLIFYLVGVIITFFILYLASLLIPSFDAVSGVLYFFVAIKGLDSVLTLLTASVIAMSIAYLTNWATVGLE